MNFYNLKLWSVDICDNRSETSGLTGGSHEQNMETTTKETFPTTSAKIDLQPRQAIQTSRPWHSCGKNQY